MRNSVDTVNRNERPLRPVLQRGGPLSWVHPKLKEGSPLSCLSAPHPTPVPECVATTEKVVSIFMYEGLHFMKTPRSGLSRKALAVRS